MRAFQNRGCQKYAVGQEFLFNRRFEVSDEIPGSMVVVYYLPWSTDYILVGPDKTYVKPLDATRNALRFDKPYRGGTTNKKEKQP